MPRFRNLTKAQENAFGLLACGQSPNCTLKTIEALVAAGLVEVRNTPEHIPGLSGALFIRTTYEVPIAVHLEWCQWCARGNYAL